ncbi:hypothetical protein F4802DRAFT_343244 [Xylaria palmicola]|nr:hypothetical protein F4802DRAFT_343244 [Xylaria palmicola]
MNTASPSKRRALAPVDANTRSPLGAARLSPSKLDLSKAKTNLGPSLVQSRPIKRPIEEDYDQENNGVAPDSTKKRRLSEAGAASHVPKNERPPSKEVDENTRPRSVSPEDPSIFDNSTIENSQVTVISEPDVETTTSHAAAAATAESRPRQGSMTREEARQKAEILRLRLGLASYKVRTNQADVPLEKLQVRPIRGKFPRPISSMVLSLPPLPAASSPRNMTTMSRKQPEKKRSDSPVRTAGPSPRRVLPTAPSQRRESGASAPRCAETAADKSPAGKREPEQTLPPPAGLNTPERRAAEREDAVSDSELGGAAEGLLSLSQSSPASVLK